MMNDKSKPTCFVAKVDLSLKEKLKGDLLEQGFSLKEIPYAYFSAQKQGVSCTLYQSGKLTVQGKKKDEFIQYYLEPEILHSFEYSYAELSVNKIPHIGSDEAGKGDFFGPLCVAAVFSGDDKTLDLWKLGIQDSKTITDKRIKGMAQKIKALVPYHVVIISPKKYNELYPKFGNLNTLLAWAHATAISHLVEKVGPQPVLVDKFAHESLVLKALKQKQLTLDVEQRPRAEEDTVVAAASVLARNAFVESMDRLEQEAGTPIPKGASKKVIQAGKVLKSKIGTNNLENYCKKHFVTYQEIQ